jgi:Domain of unknown function (DUF6883)
VNLRNAHLAIVEHHKVTGYLMNSTHPDNGGKAQFFESLGFSIENPEALISALRIVAQTGEVVQSVESPHGEKLLSMARYRRKLRRADAGRCGRSGSSIEALKHLAW